MTGLTMALVALAVYRGTLLVTHDKITSGPRRRLRHWLAKNGHARTHYLLTCPWCVSLYLGSIGAAVAWAWPEGWWRWPALGLAASGVTGLMATVAAPDPDADA